MSETVSGLRCRYSVTTETPAHFPLFILHSVHETAEPKSEQCYAEQASVNTVAAFLVPIKNRLLYQSL